MVLTHKDCLDGSAVPQGQHGCAATATLPPSHAYPTVSFVASSPQWLGLYCPGDGPDRELLDGTFMDQSWPGGENGRSWCYDPALSSDPEHNDQPDPWLPTLDATPYTEDPGTGEPNFGTPGEVGSCLPEGPPVPVRGELLITEVMVAPAGLPEWIEVANLSAEARSLGGCTLNHVKVDEDGDPASDVSQFLLGSGGGIPVLEPGGRWVLTEDDCLDGADPEVGDCALDNESWYAGIGLSNDARHLIWIECPGSEDAVDEVVAAPDLADPPYGVRNAHSMAFVPDSVDCGGLDPEDCNDAPELWCEAGFDHPYPVGSTDPENYGTPGEVGGCSLGGEGNGEGGGDDDDTCLSPGGCADPECGCDCNGAVGGRPPNAAIAWLMGVALLLLRRRRADPGD
jgi:MYXO-CTERM domain-containing protein